VRIVDRRRRESPTEIAALNTDGVCIDREFLFLFQPRDSISEKAVPDRSTAQPRRSA